MKLRIGDYYDGSIKFCAGAAQDRLGLAGGGSHGAFTWCVLDQMLEETTIEIIGVTGTSAGAMNAVAFPTG